MTNDSELGDSQPRCEIIPVRTPVDLSAIKNLFQAYAVSLQIDLSFQDFAVELADLPGKYAPLKGGELLLARDSVTGQAVGCIGLRNLSPGSTDSMSRVGGAASDCGSKIAELKRLYVSPSMRGTGLGQRLASQMLEHAEKIGYTEVKLDTLSSMNAAQRMYERFGFVDVEPYCYNPEPEVRYMGLKLPRNNP